MNWFPSKAGFKGALFLVEFVGQVQFYKICIVNIKHSNSLSHPLPQTMGLV